MSESNGDARSSFVHVSLHDVSPAFATEIEMALALCEEQAVRPALLVVPNFHGDWPLLDHPEFVSRLRDLAARGHEIYLHGFFHKSRPSMSSDLGGGAGAWMRWQLAQRGSSDHEAEFSDLTPADAADRLEEGERVLAGARLSIAGFVPPAWSMQRWLLPMLGARGYRYCEDHTRIYDPVTGRAAWSLVLNYATRTPTRLLSTLAYCRAALPLAKHAPARVALHPGDMRYQLVRRELAHVLGQLRGRFTRDQRIGP